MRVQAGYCLKKTIVRLTIKPVLHLLLYYLATGVHLVESEPAAQTTNKTLLTVGYSNWPPFFITDKDGNVGGVNADIIRAAMQPQGYRIQFTNISWTRGLHGLSLGSIDIMTSATYTQARAQYASYSNPYYVEQYALYGKKTEAEQYAQQSLSKLLKQEFRLGVHQGTAYDLQTMQVLKQTKFQSRISVQTNFLHNYRMLARGRIDGFLQERSEFQYLHNNHPVADQFEPYIYLSIVPQHVLFSKQSASQKVVQDFNAGLKHIITNGEYLDIFSHWDATDWMLDHSIHDSQQRSE